METNWYLGKQFGSYRLIEKLDSGGFGSVYLARHIVLAKRTVAVKLLHTMYMDSEEVRESFLEEARFLEMLKHPSILPIIDINIAEDGFPYLVTEYAAGGSLRTRMRARKTEPFSLNEVLQILAQTGAGLSYAHERNIIHRDLKPENILFNEKGEALLADFGLATTLATASEKYVSASGTPAYMAPEQFKGLVSKESDQYALGCIVYELLTGQKPFLGNNAIEMMYQHLQEQPVPPTSLNAKLSPRVEGVLLKALAKTRQERFASIVHFLQALEEVVHEEERREDKLCTEPVLSQWETKQTGGEVALEEQLPRLVAVEQEQGPIENVRSSASTVEMTLRKERGNVLPLPARIDPDRAEEFEESDRQLAETGQAEEVPMEPTPKAPRSSTSKPLPSILRTQKDLALANSPLITKKLGLKTTGNAAVPTGKKAYARRSMVVAAVLIMTIAILTPAITSTLSYASGSTSQGKTRQSTTGVVRTDPTAVETSMATKAVLKNTPMIQPTTAPIVIGVPTPMFVPTPTPAIVPTPTPTPLPAPPAKLLASKGSFYGEDDCSWGNDNSVTDWGCTETLSNVAGAQSSISWSSSATGNSSNQLPLTRFSPSSGTINPGQSVTVSILIEGQGKTSCVVPPENLIFTSSSNTLTIPWHCSGPMPTISPASLGGANHTDCSLDTSGSNWLCTVTITAHKPGTDIWSGNGTGINGISFGDPGYGYFGLVASGGSQQSSPIAVTIPVVNCPATATITITTSFTAFNIPWSC